MRIMQNKPVERARKSSKAARSSGAGGVFTLDTSPSQAPAASSTQISAPLPVGDISMLLAVQGDDRQRERSIAVDRGYDTLNALDALKVDVLSGQLSRHKLLNLARLVDKQRQHLGDEGLMNVLDHIELRARVELAKFEKNQH